MPGFSTAGRRPRSTSSLAGRPRPTPSSDGSRGRALKAFKVDATLWHGIILSDHPPPMIAGADQLDKGGGWQWRAWPVGCGGKRPNYVRDGRGIWDRRVLARGWWCLPLIFHLCREKWVHKSVVWGILSCCSHLCWFHQALDAQCRSGSGRLAKGSTAISLGVVSSTTHHVVAYRVISI